ncbi:MAG: hypothetical protein R3253_10815 [Longimicrobiales bacterium]|nr:hypothetical protein [Longimicrobiales bacterium]
MMRRTLFCALAGLTLAACSARAGVEVQPSVVAGAGGSDGDKIWVCHRGTWQEVGAPAGSAHERHGDRISEAPRRAGGSC